MYLATKLIVKPILGMLCFMEKIYFSRFKCIILPFAFCLLSSHSFITIKKIFFTTNHLWYGGLLLHGSFLFCFVWCTVLCSMGRVQGNVINMHIFLLMYLLSHIPKAYEMWTDMLWHTQFCHNLNIDLNR